MPAYGAVHARTATPAPGVVRLEPLKYAYRLESVTLRKSGGSRGGRDRAAAVGLDVIAVSPARRGRRQGNPLPTEHEGPNLKLLDWNPWPWVVNMSNGGAGQPGDPVSTVEDLCDPKPVPRRRCLLGRSARRAGFNRVRLRAAQPPQPPYPSRFFVTGEPVVRVGAETLRGRPLQSLITLAGRPHRARGGRRPGLCRRRARHVGEPRLSTADRAARHRRRRRRAAGPDVAMGRSVQPARHRSHSHADDLRRTWAGHPAWRRWGCGAVRRLPRAEAERKRDNAAASAHDDLHRRSRRAAAACRQRRPKRGAAAARRRWQRRGAVPGLRRADRAGRAVRSHRGARRAVGRPRQGGGARNERAGARRRCDDGSIRRSAHARVPRAGHRRRAADGR